MTTSMLKHTVAAIALVAVFAPSAGAVPITVDEILYDSSTNASLLSGTVDMSLLGNLLTITLTNTSADAAGSGAGILLTGIGFNLPSGVSILGGSASMLGSTAVGFTAPLLGSVSREWGYDSPPLHSGALLGVAALTYNTSVSSMESATTSQFQSGSIGNPPNLGGPDFGLVSASETGSLGNGNEAIRSSIYITLVLAGAVPLNLLQSIESSNVALTFGSPDATSIRSVPEPTSLSLFGLGLAGVAVAMRRSMKKGD